MNEIEAQECYDAIGILLAHRDALDSITKTESVSRACGVPAILDAIQQTLISHLPCKHANYTILDEIYAKHGSEVELRIKCNNCNHLGCKVYNESDLIGWDS